MNKKDLSGAIAPETPVGVSPGKEVWGSDAIAAYTSAVPIRIPPRLIVESERP